MNRPSTRTATAELCYWSCLFESPNDLLVASQALIAMGGPPFNRFDNIVERDLFGRTGKGISTACSSLGFDKAAARQILNDFRQKLWRDFLLLGNLRY